MERTPNALAKLVLDVRYGRKSLAQIETTEQLTFGSNIARALIRASQKRDLGQAFGLDLIQLQFSAVLFGVAAGVGFGLNGLQDRQRFIEKQIKYHPQLTEGQALAVYDPWRIQTAVVLFILASLAMFGGLTVRALVQEEYLAAFINSLMGIGFLVYFARMFGQIEPKRSKRKDSPE